MEPNESSVITRLDGKTCIEPASLQCESRMIVKVKFETSSLFLTLIVTLLLNLKIRKMILPALRFWDQVNVNCVEQQPRPEQFRWDIFIRVETAKHSIVAMFLRSSSGMGRILEL